MYIIIIIIQRLIFFDSIFLSFRLLYTRLSLLFNFTTVFVHLSLVFRYNLLMIVTMPKSSLSKIQSLSTNSSSADLCTRKDKIERHYEQLFSAYHPHIPYVIHCIISYQLARNILCRAIGVKNASFERARKTGCNGLIFPRAYSQVPRKAIQNTFPIMYIQEKLSFYTSLSTIFFCSLFSYISFDINMNM